MAVKFRCKIIETDEYLTSKTCSKCKTINENFKLIESSKLKEYIENKIKETQPTSPFKDGSISMTFDLDNNVNDDTMECLLLYYVILLQILLILL